MRFAIVNTKGGVGKTTTAVHLATLLAKDQSTLLIDGDPQASAASWAAWRKENEKYTYSPTTVCLTGKAVFQEGKVLANNFDHVVVDAGGRDTSSLRSALLLAQQAIIPVGASNLDAAAMTDLLTVVDMAKDYNPELSVKVLLSRVDQRTKDTLEMQKYLIENHLELFETKITERVAFRRAIGEGAIVNELNKDPIAVKEIMSFFEEIKL